MKQEIIDKINDILPEIQFKEKNGEDSNIYALIARQLEFLKECHEQRVDYKKKLGEKKLNFGIVASRSFSGPDEELEKKISAINALLIKNKKSSS